MGDPDPAKCEEALGFIKQQIIPVEKQLGETKFIAGKEITIADYMAYAYTDQARTVDFDLSAYPNINAWIKKMDSLESVKKTKSKINF